MNMNVNRLTERGDGGGITVRDAPAAFEKLAGLEDDEQKGRLLRLPFAPGDTVYRLQWTNSKCDALRVESWRVSAIQIDTDGVNIVLRRGEDGFEYCVPSDVGKTVYLTSEEAEAALKERMG